MNTPHRVLNRLLAALVGLVLALAGLLLTVEIVVGLLGGSRFVVPRQEWLDALRTTTWAAGPVRLTGTALVVVGVLLLLAAVTARTRILPMRSPRSTLTVEVPARTVAQILRRTAEAVPGVKEATAEVSARAARVTATVPLADPARVQRDLDAALGAALTAVPWPRVPTLQVEVASPRLDAGPVAPGRAR